MFNNKNITKTYIGIYTLNANDALHDNILLPIQLFFKKNMYHIIRVDTTMT